MASFDEQMEHNNPDYYFVNRSEYVQGLSGDLYNDPEEEPLSNNELAIIQTIILLNQNYFVDDYYDVWDDDIVQYYMEEL